MEKFKWQNYDRIMKIFGEWLSVLLEKKLFDLIVGKVMATVEKVAYTPYFDLIVKLTVCQKLLQLGTLYFKWKV